MNSFSRKNRTAIVGLVVVLGISLVGMYAPFLFTRPEPAPLTPPSAETPFLLETASSSEIASSSVPTSTVLENRAGGSKKTEVPEGFFGLEEEQNLFGDLEGKLEQ